MLQTIRFTEFQASAWIPAFAGTTRYLAVTGTHNFCSIPVTASAGAGRPR
jgi:hypothetical protein